MEIQKLFSKQFRKLVNSMEVELKNKNEEEKKELEKRIFKLKNVSTAVQMLEFIDFEWNLHYGAWYFILLNFFFKKKIFKLLKKNISFIQLTNTFIKYYLGSTSESKKFEEEELKELENIVNCDLEDEVVGYEECTQEELIKNITEQSNHKKMDLSQLSVPVLFSMENQLTDLFRKNTGKDKIPLSDYGNSFLKKISKLKLKFL